MEEDYEEKLEKHHLDIVKCLDLDRQYILSHLRSKFILDDEDCQIIRSGASRQQQAAKFIDILMTKGPKGFMYFIEALEIEHPHLYEKITGNEVAFQMNCSLHEKISSWSALTHKELIDFDQSYLLKELKKATNSNRDNLYQHERFLQEKKAMELKMKDVLKELKDREELIQDLRNSLDSKSKGDVQVKLETEVQTYAKQAEELSRANFDKSCKIITLQSQLLAAREHFEKFRKTNEVLRCKNENLMEQVRDLTINYDFQRSQSKRLSRQVNMNNCELKQVAEKKREMLSLRFELSKVKEERDELTIQLEDMTKRNLESEKLCDLLREENSNAEVGRGKISGNLVSMQSTIRQLESKLQDEENSKEMHKRRSERLLGELEALKEQRDFFIKEREQAITERDQIRDELDVCLRLKQDVQKLRDDMVQEQISIMTDLEKKNSALVKEVDRLTEELNQIRSTDETEHRQKRPLTRISALYIYESDAESKTNQKCERMNINVNQLLPQENKITLTTRTRLNAMSKSHTLSPRRPVTLLQIAGKDRRHSLPAVLDESYNTRL